jgi:hypothetical protein
MAENAPRADAGIKGRLGQRFGRRLLPGGIGKAQGW